MNDSEYITMFIPLLLIHFISSSAQTLHSCTSRVFCQGPLLHTVQMAQIFPDSKTFVDLKMINDESTTLKNFNKLPHNYRKLTKRQIKDFLLENFEQKQEFEAWTPPDFKNNPKFLQQISVEVREFAQALVNIWPQLARKVKPEVLNLSHLYTILPVDNGFIIPGGRFREFYYWDSFWIIQGLLLCEMYDTVKGILDNFISLVRRYGFVPNGSRIYYLNRSQPPLLTLMVAAYLDATNDTKWLHQNIEFLEEELYFFLNNRITQVVKNNKRYFLAHYASKDATPRPESYHEDLTTASILTNKGTLFADLKSAAESGWDFSSRWIVDEEGGTNANLTFTQTKRIIPVDLNSFLGQSFHKLSELFLVLNNHDRAWFWNTKAELWVQNIHKVFYHDEDGIWYDWDNTMGHHRRFFYPSNLTPLWSGTYNQKEAKKFGQRAVEYLIKSRVLEFQGGVPTSLVQSGEQWDYPNAWPPLQAIVIQGLDQSGSYLAQKVAQELAHKWVESNYASFRKTNQMFEKYNVQYYGKSGNGGEYEVQSGFGWTNGVLLQLISRYYRNKENS